MLGFSCLIFRVGLFFIVNIQWQGMPQVYKKAIKVDPLITTFQFHIILEAQECH
jgi:hypothetical protein